MAQQNPFQWEHPKASDYNDTIRRRIIGYDTIFQLMADSVQVNNSNPNRFLIVIRLLLNASSSFKFNVT